MKSQWRSVDAIFRKKERLLDYFTLKTSLCNPSSVMTPENSLAISSGMLPPSNLEENSTPFYQQDNPHPFPVLHLCAD